MTDTEKIDCIYKAIIGSTSTDTLLFVASYLVSQCFLVNRYISTVVNPPPEHVCSEECLKSGFEHIVGLNNKAIERAFASLPKEVVESIKKSVQFMGNVEAN